MAAKGKRQAEATIASKSKKISRLQEQKHVEKSDEEQQEEEGEGLFDNLDEEMDPNELENIMQQLNEQDSQEEEEEEENEINEFNDSESEELQELNEEEKEENSPSESEEEEEEEEEDVTMEEQQTPVQENNTEKKFRDYYMTKITQAFGTDLDQIRQEPTLRVNVLIDSLEAGINIYSNLEQEIILADEQ